ncbi:homoserine kinase [Vulcanimicrobium alpinum]|uniref:Homoserine kinase n=1 Tax=Vulcanimicrobium alpinum TaxID=3016050 RepID=A0AAN1XW07_UNVUL|nr:homoserine kinase [Vulcanimicrobium alpinum]BDE06455.1 homoserine kinase [Vulcanimicrobium alpinum]
MRAFRISAPASSANLGAGFDAVGIAIEIRITAEVRERAPGLANRWTYRGAHAPTHDGLRTCIEAGIAALAPSAPPLDVDLDNAIPLGAGLGSSAAAYAIGVAIGAQFAPATIEDDVQARAVAALEGHPDNALAAWYGGAVVAATGDDGLTSIRFPPPDVRAAVVVPSIVLPTAEARALLPQTYARADVVHNIQRAALLGAALAAGRIDLLRAAVRDTLHQPYRAAAIPGLREALALEDPALAAVALSGAGPSVLALVFGDPRPVAARIAACFERAGVASTVLTPALAASGVSMTLAEPATGSA